MKYCCIYINIFNVLFSCIQLAHPVLDSLKRTQDEWLVHLMRAFNAGDVKEFEALKKKWITNKLLLDHENDLRKKVIFMAIMEVRVVSFSGRGL